VTTRLAIEELEALADGDRPFLLMVSYQAPHYPVQPAPEFAARYKNRIIKHRPNCTKNIDPHTPTGSPPSPRPVENDPDYQRYGNDLDEYIRLYNAMCTQIDANLGRMFEVLRGKGLADNTLVVFTSDHGDMQGSHGLKNKYLPYEESAGIPLIVKGPGIPGGRVSDGLVSGIDFMPTFTHWTPDPHCACGFKSDKLLVASNTVIFASAASHLAILQGASEVPVSKRHWPSKQRSKIAKWPQPNGLRQK
jgi:arylsulfatase A-like enzyme